MTKLLVIEDEQDLREAIITTLQLEGFEVLDAPNGRIGIDLAQTLHPDLILCDVMMPEIDGYGVLISLRSEPRTATIPFIFLTAKTERRDVRHGMELGADDYLTKPVHHRELLAQVRAALRRSSNFSDVLEAGGLKLDPVKHAVKLDDKNLDLLPKEFALLEFLMRHPNTVFSPEALVERVWPSDSETSPDMIRKYVSRLREKIDKEGSPSLIRTVHGVGYRFETGA